MSQYNNPYNMKTPDRPALMCFYPNSFHDLMRLWQSQPYSHKAGISDFRNLMEEDSALSLILYAGPCLIWILDVRTGRYSYVSKNAARLLGYPADAFTRGGIAFLKELIHPEDAAHLWGLIRKVWNHLLSQKAQQRKGYQFSLDYRVLTAGGKYLRLFEQTTVLQTDNGGNITHLLGVWTDISCCKKSGVLNAAVYSKKDGQCLTYTSADPASACSGKLSRREEEVLRRIANGCSSRQIADELSISLHTVNTHRKKLISKTNCRTTSGLVQFAISHNII